MDSAALNDRIAASARAIDPGSTLRRVWPLALGHALLDVLVDLGRTP